MYLKILYTRTLLILSVVGMSLMFSCSSDSDNNGSVGITLTKPVAEAAETGQFIRVSANGEWHITIDVGEDTEPWLEVSPERGSGSRNDVALTYSANPDEEYRYAEIILSSGGKIVTATLTQRGISSGGNGPDPGFDLSRAQWMELPVINNRENCMFVSHSFEYNGQTMRNYSICYDTIEKISYWVAYPLHNVYLSGSSSSASWKFDPKIPSQFQINLSRYSYQGWLIDQYKHQRGHQIANADRKIPTANSQTYYSTNSTPQRQDFNAAGWMKLENWVRSKVTSDTLYVVTGAILKTVNGNESVIYDSERQPNTDNKIAVPNYYFKVLLQTYANNTTGTPYRAIGFWYPHEPNDEAVSIKRAVSVKEIEDMTGFTFFNNLPEEYAETVKSSYKPRDWSL